MSVETRLREFISSHFLTDDSRPLVNEESFVDRGILDSAGILEIVLFLEEEFGIAMSENDMVPENLDSIASLARFARSKGIE